MRGLGRALSCLALPGSYQDLVANFQCREGRDRGITDASIGGHDFQQIACQQCLNLSLQVS